MTKELDIRQQIFAKFIQIGETEKAVEYADKVNLTYSDREDAMQLVTKVEQKKHTPNNHLGFDA